MDRRSQRRIRTTIRDRMQELGVRDADVAEASGVAQSYFNRLKNGVVIPNVRTAGKVARALESTVEDLWPVGQPYQTAPEVRSASRSRGRVR